MRTRPVRSIVVAIALVSSVVVGSAASPSPSAAATKPNFLLIMTDDQNLELLRFMPNVQTLLADKGVTFANHYTSFPLCCPSRATVLTGQYSHNHGVHGNQAPYGGYDALDHTNTLPVWLQAAGYHTTHIGKYLNGYGRPDILQPAPPGWSDWQAVRGDMYDYEVNDNGTLVTYGSAPEDYETDVLRDRTLEVLDERKAGGQPFFIQLAPKAPHAEGQTEDKGPRPAPRHDGLLADEPLPMAPNFNEADVSDKPQSVRNKPLFDQAKIDEITKKFRDRAESLLAVDEMVRDIVNRLQANGQLANTVIMFTSDNGFFQGEHRFDSGKSKLYEEPARVPMIVKGKVFKGGITRTDLTWNGDIAPTILQMSGAVAGLPQDGLSLRRILARPSLTEDRTILLENGDPITGGSYTDAIRTEQYKYVEWTKANGTQEFELYDLIADPYELESRHADPTLATVRAALDAKLEVLKTCVGSACNVKYP
jgi:arylsulfatase A-like enzyme